jgi:hypothetical protein
MVCAVVTRSSIARHRDVEVGREVFSGARALQERTPQVVVGVALASAAAARMRSRVLFEPASADVREGRSAVRASCSRH